MIEVIPSPDPHSLLPPLLAFLPTAFASFRPPPDLLPLLSPILRQRLEINTSTSTSGHDSWLRLLCWDNVKAEKLKERVEEANFEPHPSSGEIEVGEVETVRYKRLDQETLKAQVPLPDWAFTAVYLWCTGSGDGDAWKLAELLPYDSDLARERTWLASIADADKACKERLVSESGQEAQKTGGRLSVPGKEEEDNDYWAQYDKTPGRTPSSHTPARKSSVNPGGAGASEADYYAQYGDVQPAMDNYDPDEDIQDAGESTLNGNSMHRLLGQQSEQQPVSSLPAYHPRPAPPEDDDVVHVNHPAPSSPSSRAGSDTVAKLEETAERYTASDIAIRQHISTSMKSMYRLAKSSGINRQDFEGMIQRELEALSFFDHDD